MTSTVNAQGNVTLLVRPSAGLTPELEKLRTQDINPDENSAAFLALTAASKSGTGSPAAASGAESDGEYST